MYGSFSFRLQCFRFVVGQKPPTGFSFVCVDRVPGTLPVPKLTAFSLSESGLRASILKPQGGGSKGWHSAKLN
jgi:hypothetical protein